MLARIRRFALDYLIADVPPLSTAERWRSIMATLTGLLLATALAWFLPMPLGHRWLVAPIGATAIILFAQPHSPLAQPWSVFGGYLVATLSATLCISLLPEAPPLAAVFAASASVGLMIFLRCLHPPGGALAFILAFNQNTTPSNALYIFLEVGLDAVLLMAAALLVNNLFFQRRYPNCRPHATNVSTGTKEPGTDHFGLTHADLSAAMQKLDTFIDVQEADLVSIYNHALANAFDRQQALRCGDIMTSKPAVVEFATELGEAWNILRSQRQSVLPVVDRNNHRLIGLLSLDDFLRQIDHGERSDPASKIGRLLQRTRRSTSEKAEVVGQIMSPTPDCVYPDTPITELIPRLTTAQKPYFPVTDENSRLLGVITPASVITPLYRQLTLAPETPPMCDSKSTKTI